MMRILLIYPYKKENVRGCNPPLSLLYLGASLLRAGYEVKIIDMDEISLGFFGILKKAKEYKPSLIGIPLFSHTIDMAHNLVNMLKKDNPNYKIVFGGPHATARPEQVLNEIKNCDYLLRGEAERSIVELVHHIKCKDSLRSVMGLSFREGNKIVSNPDAALEGDLNSIAFPARELLESAYKKKAYWRIGHRGGTDIMITSRGCPYACRFCYRMSRGYRVRSPENVLEEIILVRGKYNVRNIHIMDDTFTVDRHRCVRIMEMIKKERLRMEFQVRSRVDCIDGQILKLMKEAGVKAIVYGFESGSQKMLDRMAKGTTVESNIKILRMTKQMGLGCYADIFIGYPGETLETIKETAEFIFREEPTALNLSVMYPLPETDVYNEVRRQGDLCSDWSVGAPQPWIKLPWISSREEIVRIRNSIVRKFYLQPRVIFYTLKENFLNMSLNQLKWAIRFFINIVLSIK